MFRKKPKTVEVTVTESMYRAWLRAHRPPWDWFMLQPEMVRNRLADIGDEHLADLAEAAQGAATAAEEQDDREARIIQEEAASALRRILSAEKAPGPAGNGAPVSFGGVGERLAESLNGPEREARKGMTLFGREPDPVEEAEA